MRTYGINLAAPNGDLTARRNMSAHTGAPPVYRDTDLGVRDTDMRRHATSTEGLGRSPRGRSRRLPTPQPELTSVALATPDYTAYAQARSLYLMRTATHLYDEHMAEETIDQWRTLAKRDGHLLADCHRCKFTHAVTPDTDNCPTCGKDL